MNSGTKPLTFEDILSRWVEDGLEVVVFSVKDIENARKEAEKRKEALH